MCMCMNQQRARICLRLMFYCWRALRPACSLYYARTNGHLSYCAPHPPKTLMHAELRSHICAGGSSSSSKAQWNYYHNAAHWRRRRRRHIRSEASRRRIVVDAERSNRTAQLPITSIADGLFARGHISRKSWYIAYAGDRARSGIYIALPCPGHRSAIRNVCTPDSVCLSRSGTVSSVFGFFFIRFSHTPTRPGGASFDAMPPKNAHVVSSGSHTHSHMCSWKRKVIIRINNDTSGIHKVRISSWRRNFYSEWWLRDIA